MAAVLQLLIVAWCIVVQRKGHARHRDDGKQASINACHLSYITIQHTVSLSIVAATMTQS